MAYSATLINRLAQFGQVNYDIIVEDDGGRPSFRFSIKMKIENDIPTNQLKICQKYQQYCNNKLSNNGRLNDLQDKLQTIYDRIQNIDDERQKLLLDKQTIQDNIASGNY